MQFGQFAFRPSLLAVVATAIAVGVFGYLALWQLGRADERTAQRNQVLERSAEPARDYEVSGAVLAQDRYRRFSLQGRFVNDHQLLLDNVVRDGQAGYEVITPFTLTSGEVVLVNRGWLSAGRDRQQLPDVAVEETSQQLLASLDKPRSAPVVGVEPIENGMRWNYLDVEVYRQVSGFNVPAYLFLQSADTGPGYDRNWPEVADKRGMHIGYAIHWAAFALIALGTFLGVNIKRVK